MMKMLHIALLLVLAKTIPAEEHAQNDTNGNFRVIARLINDCGAHEDMSLCFKIKALSFLDRMVRTQAAVPITGFVSVVRDESAAVSEDNETAPSTEQEIEQMLPRSLEEKSRKLDDLLWNKFFTLLSTRKLQFNVPNEYFEGRGKDKLMKKGGGMMMVAAMMGGMMMKMMMGGIGMMAGKALLISKVALVLALVIALKKLSGGGGGGESHPQVVYAPAEHGGGGGGGYRRRQSDAQNLAYGSQNPDYYNN